MKTQMEIVSHIKDVLEKDQVGLESQFILEVLTPYLDFVHVKDFLVEGAKEEDWEPEPLTEERVLKHAASYAEFAWEKVLGHRGISASRNIAKLTAWAWLLDHDRTDEVLDKIASDEIPYPQYGAPQLAALCEHLGFAIPDDEEVRRMRAGMPCEDGCNRGCGR